MGDMDAAGIRHLDLERPRAVNPARAPLNLGVLVVMAPISRQGSGESRPSAG